MNISIGSLESNAASEHEIPPDEKLPYFVYLSTCLSYLFLIALAAILIDDLTLVFGIIAGFAECTTVFILPSLFYLIARAKEQKKFETDDKHTGEKIKGGSCVTIFLVYVYLAMGIAYFIISNYYTFAKIFK